MINFPTITEAKNLRIKNRIQRIGQPKSLLWFELCLSHDGSPIGWGRLELYFAYIHISDAPNVWNIWLYVINCLIAWFNVFFAYNF